ncbi:glycoside hydrolase 15 protein [Oleoguttula sp. CCFEE 5521]
MRSSSFVLRAALAALSIPGDIRVALAQSPTPAQSWAPAATCSNGGPNPTGGAYTDKFGANYSVSCGQDLTGMTFASAGVTGQGIYGCFKGCDNRPTCSAFGYNGTVTGPTSGTGTCYYRAVAGNYITANIYAAANMISNGTPQLPCPYYNQTVFTDASSVRWQVFCGYDQNALSAANPVSYGVNMADCLAQCGASSDCSSVSYVYSGDEPVDGNTADKHGQCFFKRGAYSPNGGGTATVNFAAMVTPRSTSSVSAAAATTTTSATATYSSVPSPTATWTPAAACTAGGPAATGGAYTDANSAVWNVVCGADNNNGQYFESAKTNGQGIYACAKGCDQRPACSGYSFIGTVSGATTGSGVCYYKSAAANAYYYNSTVYAATNLISGSRNLPCPYYNGGNYTASNGAVYSIYCGQDSSTTSSSNAAVQNMAQCVNLCETTAGCTGASYIYSTSNAQTPQGVETKDGETTTFGTCYFRTTAPATPGTSQYRNFALRIANAGGSPPSSATTISSSTSAAAAATSSAAAACNGTPSPGLSTLSCNGANAGAGNIGQYTDACGGLYTVYCGNDTDAGGIGVTAMPATIQGCMQACDQYTAATLKTSFRTLTAGNPNLAALVRYVPPNPNYAAPVTSTAGGCGSALPYGLVADGASVLVNFTSPTDGLPRNALIHIPKFYTTTKASPVIFGFHGNNADAPTIESQTGFSNGNLNPYAIAVYVNGYGKGYQSNPSWAPGGQYANVDDIGFTNYLIANITATFCVDTTRIFAVGHSNGGGFVGVIACDPGLSSKFAAIAGNSAALYTNVSNNAVPLPDPNTIDPVNTPVQPVCRISKQLPIFESHGTGDTQIQYAGATDHNGLVLPSLPHWATNRAQLEGFSTTNYTTYPSTGVTMYQFGGAVGQLGIITHYRLENWPHAWPSVAGGAPIDISPKMMDFYYRFSDPNRPLTYSPTVSSSSSSSMTMSSTSSSSSAACTAQAVSFSDLRTINFGESLALVGSVPQLGSWNTAQAVSMSSSNYSTDYPQWQTVVTFPLGTYMELKFLWLHNGSVDYEDGTNHMYTVPSTCTTPAPSLRYSWQYSTTSTSSSSTATSSSSPVSSSSGVSTSSSSSVSSSSSMSTASSSFTSSSSSATTSSSSSSSLMTSSSTSATTTLSSTLTSSSSSSTSAACSAVSIMFKELRTTVVGESVYLVGSVPQLGSWNTSNAILLSAGNYTNAYPQWTTTVSFPLSTYFEYKYLLQHIDGSREYESDPNHVYTVANTCPITPQSCNDSWQYSVTSTSSSSTASRTSTSSSSSTSTSATPTCTAVTIAFSELRRTVFGESVYLLGSVPQLGAWNVSNEILMSSANYSDMYPQWTTSVSFSLGTYIEYKYRIGHTDGSQEFESGANHMYTVLSTCPNTPQSCNDSWQYMSTSSSSMSSTSTISSTTRSSSSSSASASATLCPIMFSELRSTNFGESISIVGSIPELGSWDTSSAAYMLGTNYTQAYPQWQRTLNIAPGTSFSYNHILFATDGTITYEADPDLSYTVPLGCSSANPAMRYDSWQYPPASTTSTSATSTASSSSTASASCTQSIAFNLLRQSAFGESISIIGSAPELGSWSVNSSVYMTATNYSDSYPHWQRTVTFPRAGAGFQYSYILYRANGDVVNEESPNRSYYFSNVCGFAATVSDSWQYPASTSSSSSSMLATSSLSSSSLATSWSSTVTSSSSRSSTVSSSSASASCTQSLTFSVLRSTQFGESISVIGSAPELGTWNVSSAVYLTASNYSSSFPQWQRTVTFLTAGSGTQYKYILFQANGTVVYEEPPNRSYYFSNVCGFAGSVSDTWQYPITTTMSSTSTSTATTGSTTSTSTSTACAQVPVQFNVLEATGFGESISIVGSVSQLGSFNTSNSVHMVATNYSDSYPNWQRTVNLPPSTSLYFKYIKYHVDGSLEYEGGSDRPYTVPANCDYPAVLNNVWQPVPTTTSSSSSSIRTSSSTTSSASTASTSAACSAVPVQYNVLRATLFGESISLVGSAPGLGSWNTSNAKYMLATNYTESYPNWQTTINLPPGLSTTFKYLIYHTDGSFEYEDGNDRSYVVPPICDYLAVLQNSWQYASTSTSSARSSTSATPSPTCTKAAITFDEYRVTTFGESISIVGSAPELGSWNVSNAAYLLAASDYSTSSPRWTRTLDFTLGESFEWKAIIYHNDGSFEYESGMNHYYVAPTSCSAAAEISTAWQYPASTSTSATVSATPTCTTVSVRFDEYRSTEYGESISIVGSIPALGSWNTSAALYLTTAGDYSSSNPHWTRSVDIGPLGTGFSWKAILFRTDGSILYESGADHYSVLPNMCTNTTISNSWQYDTTTSASTSTMSMLSSSTSSASSTCTAIPVGFSVYEQTSFGESISVVGSVPQLGSWNTTNSVYMTASANYSASYPEWSSGVVYFTPGSQFSYKYIRYSTDGTVTYEGGNDRFFIVPSTCPSSTVNLQDTWQDSPATSNPPPLSTASSTSASTSASATPSGPPLDCPRDAGKYYTDQYTNQFTVLCYRDLYEMVSVDRRVATDLANCIEQCDYDLDGACTSVSWLVSGQDEQWCYYHSANSTIIQDPDGAVAYSARLTSLVNGTQSSSSSVMMGMTSTSSMSSMSAINPRSTSSTSSPVAITTTSGTSTFSTVSSSMTPSLSPISGPGPCPASNGTSYTDSMGMTYTIYCDSDSSPGSYNSASAPSFGACISQCDQDTSCAAVGFNGNDLSGGFCYLKASVEQVVPSTGIRLAVRVIPGSYPTPSSSVSTSTSAMMMSSTTISTTSTSSSSAAPTATLAALCPSSNGTTYTDQAGESYMIVCDTDCSPGAFSSVPADNFRACIDACDAQTQPACGAASFVGSETTGGNCYLKSPPTSYTSSPGVNLAVRVIPSYGTSTSSMASTSSLSSSISSTSSLAPPPYSSPAVATSSSSSTSMSTSTAIATSSSKSGSSTSSLSTSSLSSTGAATPPVYSVPSTSSSSTTSTSSGVSSTMSASAMTSPSSTSSRPSASMVLSSNTSSARPPAYTSSAGALTTSMSSSASSSMTSSSSLSTTSLSSSKSPLSSSSAISSSSSLALSPSLSATSSVTASTASYTSTSLRTSSSLTSSAASSTVVLTSSSAGLTTSTQLSTSVAGSPPAYTPPSSALSSSSKASSTLSSSSSSAPISSSQNAPPPYSSPQQLTTSSSPFYMSISSSSYTSMTPLPSCGAGTMSGGLTSMAGNGSACADSYGNSYNVTYGSTQYTGKVTKRASTTTVDACLTLCDQTADCKGANYVGTDCTLFSEITGTTVVTTGPPAVAASRPPDVSTVYTAPPTSTPPVSTTPGQPPAYDVTTSSSATPTSVSSGPGSTPALTTAPMTSSMASASSSVASPPVYAGSNIASSSTATSRTSSSLTSSEGLPSYGGSYSMSSTPAGSSPPGYGSSPIASTLLSASLPGQYSSMSSGPSASSGASIPGQYGSSSATSVITSQASTPLSPYGQTPTSSPNGSAQSVSSSGSSPGYPSGYITSSPATSSSPTATPTLCPAYDGKNYTESNGASYTVTCNKVYTGRIYMRYTKPQSLASCLASCDQYAACAAVSNDDTGCTLFSSTTGTTTSQGGSGASKVNGPTSNVVTVTVCGVRPTTTVFATATSTMCPAHEMCTAPAQRYPQGFIGNGR